MYHTRHMKGPCANPPPSHTQSQTCTDCSPYTLRCTDMMLSGCPLAPWRPAENAYWLDADCVVMETDLSPVCDLMKAT